MASSASRLPYRRTVNSHASIHKPGRQAERRQDATEVNDVGKELIQRLDWARRRNFVPEDIGLILNAAEQRIGLLRRFARQARQQPERWSVWRIPGEAL